MDHLLSVREAAPLLRVSANTLYLMVADRRSPVEPIRIGRKIWFRRVDIEALLGAALDEAG